MTTNLELAQTVVKVLREAATLHLDFQYKDFGVTSMRYSVMADYVQQGRIACNVGVPKLAGYSAGSFARALCVPSAGNEENPPPDQIRLPRENYGEFSGREKMDIVHEATHAIHDVFLARSVLAIEDEATARLAQALYIRKSANTFSLGGMLVDGPLDRALTLADRIISNNVGNRTFQLHEPDVQMLKHAVALEYNYLDGRAGILSVYDGVPKR
jgi:hypothetical protein